MGAVGGAMPWDIPACTPIGRGSNAVGTRPSGTALLAFIMEAIGGVELEEATASDIIETGTSKDTNQYQAVNVWWNTAW